MMMMPCKLLTVSLDEAWFDSHPVFEADWDEDFYSIQEGIYKQFKHVLIPSQYS